MSQLPAMTYLADGLWMGGHPSLHALREHQIDLVITVTRPSLATRGIGGEFEHVQIPFADNRHLPHMSRIMPGVMAAVCALRDGKRVLVHCAGGLNRSGLVAGLILYEYSGWPGPAIVAFIQQQRPTALNNDTFREFLLALPERTP